MLFFFKKKTFSGLFHFCLTIFLVYLPMTSNIALWQLDLATSGKGGIGPFLGVCAFVACFGVADALVQGGMVGDLSFMLPELVQVGILV